MTTLQSNLISLYNQFHNDRICPICNSNLTYTTKPTKLYCNNCDLYSANRMVYINGYGIYPFFKSYYSISFKHNPDHISLDINSSFNSIGGLLNHLNKLSIFQ